MKNVSQRVKFLDVGHGDSSIVYLCDEKSEIEKVIIMDVADSDKVLKELAEKNIKVINLIVISHSDADHCRGVSDFIEKFLVEGIVDKICFNLDKRTPTKTMKLYLKKFLELHYKYNIELLRGEMDSKAGEKELISNGKSTLVMIYPNIAEATNAYLKNNTNDTSIVCLLRNNGGDTLFTGDLEKEGWASMLKRKPNLKCEILKMPHHGAFYSDGANFGLSEILETLDLEVAIISSGENRKYKHPSKQTIQLLLEKKVKVYCTKFTELCHCNTAEYHGKCFGNIEVQTDISNYAIKCETNNFKLLDHIACNG